LTHGVDNGGIKRINASLLLITTAASDDHGYFVFVGIARGQPNDGGKGIVHFDQCCGWYAIEYGQVNIHETSGEEFITRMRAHAKQLHAAAEYADEQAKEAQRQSARE
jgi:hypothetical protein